jgi:HAD superfamily hydrolase (TIGR01509 family)
MAKAVIFDMDGVLFDSQPLHFDAERRTTQAFGHAMTDPELKEYLGWTEDAFWNAVIARFGFKTTAAEMRRMKKPIFEGLIRKSVRKDAELASLIDTLRVRGVKTAVASSSPMEWINIILSGLGVRDKFDAVISGESVARSKPAPDIFLAAAAAIDVSPKDCMVVEDAPAGITAANSAGMYSVALLNRSNDGLDFSNSRRRIRKLPDILDLTDFFGIKKQG